MDDHVTLCPLTSFIVDNEPLDVDDLLEKLKTHCPSVQNVGVSYKPEEAIGRIKDLKPDVVFLDVEMPYLNGMEMLQKMGKINFAVVFVTAYGEYVLDALRLQALDYLLKPVGPDKLIEAVARVCDRKMEYLEQQQLLLEELMAKPLEHVWLCVGRKTMKKNLFSEILYFEAYGDYVHLSFKEKNNPAKEESSPAKEKNSPVFVDESLKSLQQKLEPFDFCRIHHSHLINLRMVEGYSPESATMEGGAVLSVSQSKRQTFMEAMKRFLEKGK